MAPRKRAAKAVAKAHVAETRHSGRIAARSANVAKQSGLAMSTSIPQESPRARTPRRPSARGKWSEQQLMTSDKSPLIDLDLVKLLAQPEAWNCLDESEKREILALLPPDVHPEAQAILDDQNAKIEPIPDSFIRYSNNWRDGVRQFQLDLQNGRYDPEWLHQAQEARQQRENGDFDNFKEREYEQFWGQKQKVVWNAPAGESARVKMKTLIDEGVIQLGDIWRFHYVYGKGTSRVVIEKETRVLGINGAKLTFAVPPGERVFLRGNFNNAEQSPTPESPKPEKGMEDMKVDFDTEPQTVSATPTEKKLEAEDPESQDAVAGLKEMETNLSTSEAQQTTTLSSNDKMNLDTDTDTKPVIAPPNDKETQEEIPNFSVVVFSPGKTRDQIPKRKIPEPEPQPPVKRKRGRPRKNPPKQPEPEVPREPEVSQKMEDSQPENPPDHFMSILEAKIAESERAAAEPSHTDSFPLKLSSAPDYPPPGSSTQVEKQEPPIADASANTNPKDDEVEPIMIANPFTSQPDTATDTAKAPAKSDQDEPDTDAVTESQKDTNPTSTSTTTSEPEAIILSNIASPQALVLQILQIDGRMPNARTSNAWKEIRCYRKNQDMGSLFDVREAWFVQHGQDE